jgi:hypothetical protein
MAQYGHRTEQGKGQDGVGSYTSFEAEPGIRPFPRWHSYDLFGFDRLIRNLRQVHFLVLYNCTNDLGLARPTGGDF